jgi:hypothetical protein
MGRLKIVDPDLAARDMGGNRQDRHAAALAIEQAIDQMEIAGTTAARAHGKVPSEMSFGSRSESGSFLMAHVDPIDRFSSPERVRNTVEGVANHTVDALHARLLESFDQIFGCCFAHQYFFLSRFQRRPRTVSFVSGGELSAMISLPF